MSEYQKTNHQSEGKTRLCKYPRVEKSKMIAFIDRYLEKEREREARLEGYNAAVSQAALLEKMCKSSSADARKARRQALIANIIAAMALAASAAALVL